MRAWMVALALCGCFSTEVGRVPNTPEAQVEIGAFVPSVDQWFCFRAESTPTLFYAVQIEESGDELIAHCLQTTGDRCDIFSGRWTRCESESVRSAIRRHLVH